MAPRVSVIIPCYQQAHFLTDSIESALGQSYHPLEVVVVDDGATDPTSEVAASYPEGPDFVIDDPYRHSPTIGELDLHLIGEGRHEELWRVLGAHEREHEGAMGTAFTVWAPNARAVRVVPAE